MDQSNKRKAPPSGSKQGKGTKRSKGGNDGRWQTSHHKAKLETLKGRNIEYGDVGIWVSCVRGKERQSVGELMNLCEKYGQKLYGVSPKDAAEDDKDEEEDIEASIQKELESMKPNKQLEEDQIFQPVRVDLDCLIFMKTKSPVDPVEMVRRICQDAKLVTDVNQRQSRFLNRFTPVTTTGKTTEQGIQEIGTKVLKEHFDLADDNESRSSENEKREEACSYAIRPSIRANSSLKRDDLINQVASLIGSNHQVNLKKPDRVILIDVYKAFLGMSVVPGDWDSLRRYNIREIYEDARKSVLPSVPTNGSNPTNMEQTPEQTDLNATGQ